MIVLETFDREPADPELPPYNEAGRILFKFDPADDVIQIIAYDGDKAPFWLNENGFMDYAIRDMIDLELEGFYVLEGVVGHAWRDYWGEYDEEWSFEYCRRATDDEIRTEALI